MSAVLFAAGLVATAAAAALVVRAILRARREADQLRRAEALTGKSLVAYHARRSQEIRAGLDALGDDAQYVFPPGHQRPMTTDVLDLLLGPMLEDTGRWCCAISGGRLAVVILDEAANITVADYTTALRLHDALDGGLLVVL